MTPEEKNVCHVDAVQLIVDTYMLLMLADYEAPKRSDLSDFQKRSLIDYKEQYVEKASLAYLDYIIHATIGENLHAISEASGRMFSPKPTSLVNGWGTISNKARSYSWQSLLKTMRKAFADYQWDSGYGGNAWATIADAGLMYKTVPDIVFLDHVVDLAHNGGLFLDKGGPLRLSRSESKYMGFLDYKKEAKSAIELMTYIVRHALPISKTVVDKFTLLYPNFEFDEIRKQTFSYDDWKFPMPEPEYKPVEFGTKELKAKFKENEYWGNEGGEDETTRYVILDQERSRRDG